MWVEAGQPASTFWDQTPRTFAAILDGAQRRDRAAFRLALFTAWQVERFGREKRLQGLSHYLDELEPKDPRQAAAQTMAFVRRLKAQADRQVDAKAAE